jgi:hypothetical protein
MCHVIIERTEVACACSMNVQLKETPKSYQTISHALILFNIKRVICKYHILSLKFKTLNI